MPSYLYHNVSANKTLSAVSDEFETINCSGGSVNITLPSLASISSGVTFKILRTDTSENTLTILPAASTSDTINGNSTLGMDVLAFREFVADTANGNWLIGSRAQ